MHRRRMKVRSARLAGEVVRPSVADFTREIDQVAVPKGDRLSDGLANWNAIIRTFTAAPLATAVVVARNGRRSRDEHSHGRRGEKRGSHDTLHFHSSPLKWWRHTRRAVLGTTRRCFGDRHTSGHARRSEWSLSNSCLRAPFPALLAAAMV